METPHPFKLQISNGSQTFSKLLGVRLNIASKMDGQYHFNMNLNPPIVF